MINDWSIENFKSVRTKASLRFAPLTLFVGQNSAGKSTVIQSILLTAQTLQSNASSRSVVLNGRILRLGSFSDIHSHNSTDLKCIGISFSLLGKSPFFREQSRTGNSGGAPRTFRSAFQDQMVSVSVAYSFSAGQDQGGAKELQLQPRLENGEMSYEVTTGKQGAKFDFYRSGDSVEDAIKRLGVEPENVQVPDLAALEYGTKSGGGTAAAGIYRRVYRLPKQTQPAGIALNHFLPAGRCVAYDALSEEVDAVFDLLVDYYSTYRTAVPDWIQTAFNEQSFRRVVLECYTAALDKATESSRARASKAILALSEQFTVEALHRVQATLSTAAKKSLAIHLGEREALIKHLLRSGRPARREVSTFPLPGNLPQAAAYVETFFTERLKYLGPLRDEPKAIYPLVGYNDPKDIGFKGEFTAAVLDDNRSQRVMYVPSAAFPFSTKASAVVVGETLAEAVQDWLRHMGIARQVVTEDKGKLGHQLTISTTEGNAFHDLTHVGVGVSQALPIIVMALLASPGSTLIFEQPELHLNPRVQTRLADFFVSLILAGKQCIVETHSEYLISRLRYLAAVAGDTSLSSHLKLYFVEKPTEESVYRDVTITDTGSIRNWPDGFFDESEKNAEAIIRARLERSRERRGNSRAEIPQ